MHNDDPTTDANNWEDFKSIINGSGLKWTFENTCKKLVFMDMTIQIKEGNIITTLYAKPLALYQYIPPNLCHPPGVLTGLVYGQILQIYQLCSKSKDINKALHQFYKLLVDRGYSRENLLPLFEKGIDNATAYILMTLEQ